MKMVDRLSERDLSQGLKRPPSLPVHRTTSSSNSIGQLSRRSAFAGSRNASEDSKTIRFKVTDSDLAGMAPGNDKILKKNLIRRLSRAPEQLMQKGGLKLRVRGHLNSKQIVQRFERQSTFHGICHASLAPNDRWRYFWYAAFGVCLTFLLIQTYMLIVKYRQFPKTVDLDLKFENAPFPSITICNLNPYKRSAIMGNPQTRKTLEAFSKLVNKGDKAEGLASLLHGDLHARVKREPRKSRTKIKDKDRRYHQVFAKCHCEVDPLSGERKAGGCFPGNKGKLSLDYEHRHLNLHPSKCLCQLDTVSKSLWPCFPYSSWKERLCAECVDSSGHCPMRFYKGHERYDEIKDEVDICLCHREYNHCIQNNENNIIPEIFPDQDHSQINLTIQSSVELFKQSKTTTTTTTTEAPEVAQALGFEELTDEIAITSQAQQNMMFTVGEMKEDDKKNMSHTKEEFIKRCSFNQKDCSIDEDFMLHYDQTYGNCFTFNFNRTKPLSAHRAGANYGLKVILYADIEEYLPTTEAVGFRITVHDKWNTPFPDAFGYNAPTGFLSAFGVRMKKFIRLGHPYGHCKNHGEADADFVYKGFNYSVEACHRSCTQKEILSNCGCADPNYPLPEREEIVYCKATSLNDRECIRNVSVAIGQKIADGNLENCVCHQPCEETNYEVTYSAARWPSGSANVLECVSGDYLCLEKYKKNAAMVQVFYEELNYETMMESPSYTFTSALADLGGLTGLWIGASVVSLLEIVTLVIFCAQAWVRKRKETSSNPPSLIMPVVHKGSTSTKLSMLDVRHSLSSHSSNKTRSKQSLMLLEELPTPIEESSPKSSLESIAQSKHSHGSCRYIAPGEELPCLCKYNEQGFIVVMKALCPVHGYMVRRGYDYSLSNSEEESEDVDEEDPEHQKLKKGSSGNLVDKE